MRFLVTAGNTREMIDSVRDWGNVFTGNTGFSIARALSLVGEVDLLTSNGGHLAELAKEGGRIVGTRFTSHRDLNGAIAGLLARHSYDAVFMTAAVADYAPAGVFAVIERREDPEHPGEEVWRVRDVHARKVTSSHKLIAVLGEPTEKLIDLFRTEWGYRGLLIKFKLEVGLGVEELLRIGENSRLASGADYLVANTLAMVAGEAAGAYLLRDGGHEWVPRGELPKRMVRLVEESTKSRPS
jgi:phosphopantothenoylcysteine synthetase/decarboxylase